MNALTREWVDKFESLNKYAVSVRYPGESATKDDARNALSAMNAARDFIRQKLGL